MSLVIANESKAKLTDLRRAYFNGCKIGLFKTSHTPVAADTLSTYSAIEANFSGYARQTISQFTTSGFLNGSNKGEIDADAITFNCTGSSPSNDIYGYFIVDPTNTYLVFAETRGAGPVTLNGSGQSYVVDLVYTVDTA